MRTAPTSEWAEHVGASGRFETGRWIPPSKLGEADSGAAAAQRTVVDLGQL